MNKYIKNKSEKNIKSKKLKTNIKKILKTIKNLLKINYF